MKPLHILTSYAGPLGQKGAWVAYLDGEHEKFGVGRLFLPRKPVDRPGHTCFHLNRPGVYEYRNFRAKKGNPMSHGFLRVAEDGKVSEYEFEDLGVGPDRVGVSLLLPDKPLFTGLDGRPCRRFKTTSYVREDIVDELLLAAYEDGRAAGIRETVEAWGIDPGSIPHFGE